MIPSLQEFMIIIIIILVLSGTGVWDIVMRGLRELRGERVEPRRSPNAAASQSDIDLSFRMLGLSPSATWDEIERAFRRKAKIHPPDHGGDEDTMRALNEAYTLIKRSRGR